MSPEPTFREITASPASATIMRLRIWLAHRLLDLGLIKAATWVVPMRPRL
jgi:hypothetical protein